MKKITVLFVLVFCLFAVPAFAETIYFKNIELPALENPEDAYVYSFDYTKYLGTDIYIAGYRNGLTDTGWFVDSAKGALGSDGMPWNWDSGGTISFMDGVNDPLYLSFYGGAGLSFFINTDVDTIYMELSSSVDELITIDLSAYGMIWSFGFYGSADTPDDKPDNIYFVALGYGTPSVPVPAAVWLLGSGIAGLGVLRKKMK